MNSFQYSSKNRSAKYIISRVRLISTHMTLLIALTVLTMNMALAARTGEVDKHQYSDYLTTLKAVGRGDYTWFGFSVYQASLWTRNGSFINFEESVPVALAITYQTDINGNDLTERTIGEWKRLGIYSEHERVAWREKLKNIWPDVKQGDSITTLVTSERMTRFYFNDELLAVLEDPGFGAALLSIWLHPDSSEPGLREKLLGIRED